MFDQLGHGIAEIWQVGGGGGGELDTTTSDLRFLLSVVFGGRLTGFVGA